MNYIEALSRYQEIGVEIEESVSLERTLDLLDEATVCVTTMSRLTAASLPAEIEEINHE